MLNLSILLHCGITYLLVRQDDSPSNNPISGWRYGFRPSALPLPVQRCIIPFCKTLPPLCNGLRKLSRSFQSAAFKILAIDTPVIAAQKVEVDIVEWAVTSVTLSWASLMTVLMPLGLCFWTQVGKYVLKYYTLCSLVLRLRPRLVCICK